MAWIYLRTLLPLQHLAVLKMPSEIQSLVGPILTCTLYTKGRSVSTGHVQIKPTSWGKNEQEQAPNSRKHTSQLAPIQSQLPDASFHLPSGSFFCSYNAGAYLKVSFTMAQIHKRKKNFAANIYSGIHIGHSVGNRLNS